MTKSHERWDGKLWTEKFNYRSSILSVQSLNGAPIGPGFYCEDNIYDHCYGAGEVGVNGMPPNVEMVYTDIGDEVIAGRDLSYCSDYDNPCRQGQSRAAEIDLRSFIHGLRHLSQA